jgi:bifunctional DNA-binding transcriptional regulator/antitoxin component of YhaV-PrlF toxin-antitoxin module
MTKVFRLDKVIGSTKVQPNNRISVIRQVQKKLNVKIGDILIYVEDEKGNIIIKKEQLTSIAARIDVHFSVSS